MKYKFFFSFLFLPLLLFSQRKSDLGFSIGAAYYMGDINPNAPFYNPGIDLGIIYRYNFNTRYVLKLEASYMKLGANDADFKDNYQLARNQSFNSPAYDLAVQFEFNFLPLKFVARKLGFSPFFSSGLAAAFLMGNSGSKMGAFVFPFSLGARSTIGKNWSIGLQWNYRKMFYDQFDGVKNLSNNSTSSVLHNNDWYSFANVSVTYKIFYFKDECPAYDKEFK
jgi:hypothetical protein